MMAEHPLIPDYQPPQGKPTGPQLTVLLSLAIVQLPWVFLGLGACDPHGPMVVTAGILAFDCAPSIAALILGTRCIWSEWHRLSNRQTFLVIVVLVWGCAWIGLAVASAVPLGYVDCL